MSNQSNRYAQNRPGKHNPATRNFQDAQKKFAPKSQNPVSKHPSPSLTLSNSLRKSSSEHAGDGSSSNSVGATPSSSRVRLGESSHSFPGAAQFGSFVNYLPQDEAVAAGLGAAEGGMDTVESQSVVDLLNRELSRLLMLKSKEFWKNVAGDSSLHTFLDSFLKFRNRWYDFPHHGAKEIIAGIIVGELQLCHRVFMVLYRISSNRDPGALSADFLNPKDHIAILQEKKLLDLPKLLDICAIYGHENEDLTRLLVSNALKAQPWLHHTLADVNSNFLSILQTMQHRCSSLLQLLFSGSHEDHGSKHVNSNFLEVMDFINDSVSSMDAFVNAYKPAAAIFLCPVETSDGNEDLVCTLVKLHDWLLPSLQKGFNLINSSRDVISSGDGINSTSSINLKLLSTRLEKFGWNLLDTCYLRDDIFEESHDLLASTKIFPAKVEDPIIRAEIIIQAFREISNLSHQVMQNQNQKTFLQQVDRSYDVIGRLRSLQSTSWITMDDEQYQYLSGILRSTSLPPHKDPPCVANSTNMSSEAQIDEEAAVLESKISQIKDLFPDYGKSFLSACLEVYNQNPEEVIQRILEGTLHNDLQSLDTSLEIVPVPKSSSSTTAKDKGKGKIWESEPIHPPINNPLPISVQQHGRGSSSSEGRFVRKPKSEAPDIETLDTRDKRDLEKTSTLALQYEYEDEYDDSFDDLGLGGVEAGFEENVELEEDGSESAVRNEQNAPSSSSKWGSRRKPQFYVKDGKNYSYKVDGSVAVANSREASLVTQAQGELIYGLGRGGNLPLGAVKRLEEAQMEEEKQRELSAANEGSREWTPRGRGRRGGGRGRESYGERDNNQSNGSEGEVRGSSETGRGRGRGRGGGGGGRNHNRKDRAMNKHFSSLSGR
ncbi:hypothetical protein SAY87_014942 [Trapa incisa]|uniref:CUE domain-containing protein n=1 Tax=Trapa incisa TaxID=236973 RepID=A0AAN7JDQ0_9MYRT|nr:hypothetical protein SAY87_014942 [Trapa incisa]